jgi:hypothetical protein
VSMKIWTPIIAVALLGSTMPRAASAAEQFVICVKDFVGCQANYFVSCQELRTDPAMRAKADQICKQERGYSNSGVMQVGTSTPGGECGTYKFIVTCR